MSWFGWLRGKRKQPRGVFDAMALQAGTPVALMGGRMRTMGLPYALPRDLEELNRLDLQHYMLRFALQGLYAVPLNNPTSMLDVGTGTGRWALDMAQVFPRAQVIGLDVNPPPADDRAAAGRDERPPNYAFAPGNVLEGMPFADGSFDYVHMRLLFTAIPSDRWPQVIRELARVTRPGGWVESVETTGLFEGGPNVAQFMEWIAQLSTRRGVNIADPLRVPDFMRAAGLANVGASTVRVPTGAHGGRLGNMVAADFTSVVRGYAGLLVNSGAATQTAYDAAMAGMRRDFEARRNRCFTAFHIAVGQRP
ncbi:MAG TPA: methyltransferase domain-containing protein [Ktedonobacterales bacterium]|nr:methyltransferase domain-containing protein [Ktedonobacterales bacterium]